MALERNDRRRKMRNGTLVAESRRFADAPTASKSHELLDLVRAIRTL